MKVIVDCGGTKADWRILGRKIEQFSTVGFSPLLQPIGDLDELLVSPDLLAIDNSAFSHVFFYGAGIVDEKLAQDVKAALAQHFGNASIEVHDDLMAAARALCGQKQGFACVLGTGSNSCYYDGDTIREQIPPLGFLLGDEGSGSALGKTLLKHYLRGQLPEVIAERFEKRFGADQKEILKTVYSTETPQRYLSSFSKFIFQNLKDRFVYQLVYDHFTIFFKEVLLHYAHIRDHQVHFSGSIAFYFSNILRQVGNDQGVSIGTIMESPISGLTLFHQD